MRPGFFTTVMVIWLCTVATGCSVRVEPLAIVPDQIQLQRHHPYSVMIDTVGTEGDEIITPTLIAGNDFREALERAISESKLFASVVRNSQADYHLEVEAKGTAPVAGFNMTCRVGGAWKLTEQNSGRIVFDEFLTAKATKGVGDAFVGATRVRLALEEASQAFILEGLQRLGRLELAR